MAIKLKDGHTYITRSGVKRVVRAIPANAAVAGLFPGGNWVFETKSLRNDGVTEVYTDRGHSWMRDSLRKPHLWDLVREVKKNAR